MDAQSCSWSREGPHPGRPCGAMPRRLTLDRPGGFVLFGAEE